MPVDIIVATANTTLNPATPKENNPISYNTKGSGLIPTNNVTLIVKNKIKINDKTLATHFRLKKDPIQ